MAMVHDAQSRSDKDRSQRTMLRFDPPHTEIPLLARIPDVTEVLAGAAAGGDENLPQETPAAEPVTIEQTPVAPEVTELEAASGAKQNQPLEAEPEIIAAEHPVRLPTAPRFSRRSKRADHSLLHRALALPGGVPDRVFWASVCGVLLLVAVVVWFNRAPGEATLPDGWENSQALTDIDVQSPEVIEPKSYVEPADMAPQVEDHSPLVTDQPVAPLSSGPTLADPYVPSWDEQQGDSSARQGNLQTPPDAARPGMARLQGIIEKPDTRAINDNTESRLY